MINKPPTASPATIPIVFEEELESSFEGDSGCEGGDKCACEGDGGGGGENNRDPGGFLGPFGGDGVFGELDDGGGDDDWEGVSDELFED